VNAPERTLSADRNTASTTSTGDFQCLWRNLGNAFIGTKVPQPEHETVGRVEDVYIDDRGAIKTVVVSVGGFSASARRTSL